MKLVYTLIITLIALPISAQNIEFTFNNAQKTTIGPNTFYEVDVMVRTIDSQPDFKLGAGQFYIAYNTAAFGNNANGIGSIEITYPNANNYILGQVNGSAYYSAVVVNDNSSSQFSVSFQQNLSAASMTNNVTSSPQKLCHLKLQYLDDSQQPQIMFVADESPLLGISKSRDQFIAACGTQSGDLDLLDCGSSLGNPFNDAIFNSEGATLSIDNLSLANTLSLHPNPVIDRLTITINQDSQFQLIDALGKTVLEGKLRTGQQQLNLEAFEAGLYILNLIGKSETTQKKILIRK
ncbi:MAG: T9SS type A sorting domain-containing protein [Winogradskyella sp.]|nr:T9SS type A sorting domain-containing protein [Winogradskyella sp.]